MSARTTLRRAAGIAAVAALVGGLGTATSSAQTFLDESDPCLGDPPPAPFADRAELTEEQRRYVDCLAAEDITRGKDGGRFDPTATVTRGQMASFLVRTLQAGGHALPAPSDQGFRDVDGNVHEVAINILAAIDVTNGKTAESFAPEEPVRRDEMASFVVRTAEYAYSTGGVRDELEGQAVEPFPFTDVAAANKHRSAIAAAFELIGVSQGTSATTYDPAGSTSRAQMATFVVRLLDVTLVPEP